MCTQAHLYLPLCELYVFVHIIHTSCSKVHLVLIMALIMLATLHQYKLRMFSCYVVLHKSCACNFDSCKTLTWYMAGVYFN